MAFNEITFTKLKSEVEQYLKDQYNKASLLFSNSSPYGQILSVLENLQQLSLLYLKKSQNNFDLGQNLTNNEVAVRNAALFAGHIPGRSISATGTLKLTLKGGTEVEAEIQGGRMTFFNRGLMKNKTNGLDYSLNLGTEQQTFRIDNNTQIYLPIIQGKWEARVLTGDGSINQTYTVDIRGRKQVENFNYEVLVNGEIWEAKKHLYDLSPGEKSCIVRTGFNGGIDIIFGNDSFGATPPIGAEIRVNYLISNGSNGSIFRRTSNDFTFVDDVVDGFGNPINIENLFDVEIFTDINFGADGETVEFTRNILPISSNNFVLGTPQQFAYEIKKLGVFSHVNAYEENGTIFVVATPNIQLFKNRNSNYFTISQEAFVLDSYEKSKVLNYLRSNGNIVLTTNIVINSPVLSYYVCNVFIITYSDAIDDSVNSQIYDKISEYFLNLNRIDRIPKVDLVTLISQIPDIHSVDISFMSKKTEDYHRNNTLFESNRKNKFSSLGNETLERPDPNYEPDKLIGIDPILGDILFEPQEIPVIRGGWVDRNKVFYADGIEGPGLKSVNIIKKGTVDVKNKQKI
jgi:hypothetical protein